MILKKGTYSIFKPNDKMGDGKIDEIPHEVENPKDTISQSRIQDVASPNIDIDRIKKSSTLDISHSTASRSESLRKMWENVKTSNKNAEKSLSDNIKSIFRRWNMSAKDGLIDWKKLLNKFVDKCYQNFRQVMPIRRFISQGKYIRGNKFEQGASGLNTVVVAVDTSGSISETQVQVFVNETVNIYKKYKVARFIIIYCSDNIDNVDEFNPMKGGTPDFTKYASTGGNQSGFKPPFKWVRDNKITPTAFIYMTDGYADFPRKSDYNIMKYEDRTLWFILQIGGSISGYVKPPFGTTISLTIADFEHGSKK